VCPSEQDGLLQTRIICAHRLGCSHYRSKIVASVASFAPVEPTGSTFPRKWALWCAVDALR
jgi:hypothetical protein